MHMSLKMVRKNDGRIWCLVWFRRTIGAAHILRYFCFNIPWFIVVAIDTGWRISVTRTKRRYKQTDKMNTIILLIWVYSVGVVGARERIVYTLHNIKYLIFVSIWMNALKCLESLSVLQLCRCVYILTECWHKEMIFYDGFTYSYCYSTLFFLISRPYVHIFSASLTRFIIRFINYESFQWKQQHEHQLKNDDMMKNDVFLRSFESRPNILVLPNVFNWTFFSSPFAEKKTRISCCIRNSLFALKFPSFSITIHTQIGDRKRKITDPINALFKCKMHCEKNFSDLKTSFKDYHVLLFDACVFYSLGFSAMLPGT